MARPLRELLLPWTEYPTELPQPSLDLPRPARLWVPALTLNDLATGEAPTRYGTAPTIETVETYPLGRGRLFHPGGGSNGIVELDFVAEAQVTNDATIIWCGHVFNYSTANGQVAGRGLDGSAWNLLLGFTGGNSVTAEVVSASPLAGYSVSVSGITATTGAEQRIALVRRGTTLLVYDWRTRQSSSTAVGTGLRVSTSGFRSGGVKTTRGGGHNSMVYSALYPAALSDADVWALLDQPALAFEPRRIWMPVGAAPSGGEGTLAATLADAASAATGTLLIQGVASVTLGAATSAATGALAITGTTTATLAAATSAATGTLLIQGTTTATLAAATLAATGELQAAGSGTLTATLADATVTAAGALQIKGVTTATLAAATSTATGALAIKGALTSTLAAATLDAEGTGQQVTTGALAVTLADATVSSAATLRIQGATTATLADATVASTGRVDIAATLGVTLDGAILVSTGSSLAAITGTLTATLADATLNAAATIADPAEVRPSAPPIGHGPALATRTPPALRRRAPNLSTRTR